VLTPFLKIAAEKNVSNINLITLTTLNFKKKTTLGPANEEATIANKKRSIKMMISLVVVFTVCWLPWHIFQTLINWLWNDLIGYVLKNIFILYVCIDLHLSVNIYFSPNKLRGS
jgi:anaerobic C4-dicarboxylate transporter